MADHPEPGDSTAVLPPGLAALLPDPWFPFTGEIAVKPLQDPVVPEPPRSDEDADTCSWCARPDTDFIWTDDDWRLLRSDPAELPGIVLLQPRRHADSFADLPPDLLAGLGPMMARVERAVLSIGDIGRVHVCRWGDGSGHFHVWFLPRPAGALQLRGSMLPMWLDLMSALPDDQVRPSMVTIARAMAIEGGTAQLRDSSAE
jgi:diadenosine tetraphosphate (Ap4A) HIT family hydrolase